MSHTTAQLSAVQPVAGRSQLLCCHVTTAGQPIVNLVRVVRKLADLTAVLAAVAGPGYQLGSSGAAQPCAPGTAKAGAGRAPCAECPARTYQPAKRQRACKPCPSGRRVNAVRTACIVYGPGVQPGRLNAPEKCPPGTLYMRCAKLPCDTRQMLA